MASRLDDSDYLSPAKRLKLENNSISDSENVSNCSPEGPTQENHSTMAPEELSHINFEIVGSDLADLPCSSVPTPVSEEQLEDLVEPLGPHDTEANENDDDDEVSSTVSNLSDISGFSDISGLDWKTDNSSSILWIQKQMAAGVNPRDVLSNILGADAHIPAELDESMLWRVVLSMITEPKCRKRLPHIGTFSDVIGLLKKCSKIMVLTGAGVSVSCGIPDFRSRDGIYSRLAVDFPNLPDPQAMFDINYFKQDPRPFFKFAREIYPGQFKPSPCHRFIKMLERHGKLLRNYTQNIDTLEQVAGIENVIECHGSFATASCTRCRHRVSADAIKEDVFAQRIPLCPNPSCAQDSQRNEQSSSPIPRPMSDEPSPSSSPRDSYQRITERGVMKPDIVFFGEGLPESFHSAMAHDKSQADLLIVIGSSLKVRPVALIPNSLPPSVPQILINRERLSHLNFDVELLGDGDVIIDTLCRALEDDWTDVCCRETPLIETRDLNPLTIPTPNLSPVPLFRNVLASDCSEGEMSIDSTRDSGLGSLMSGDRTDRQSSVDSRMEEDEREDTAATPGRGPKYNPCGNVAACCPSPIPTSSCSPNEPSGNIANPCTSNAIPPCHGRPSTSHAISSSSHAHAHHHSVERVNFNSGCGSPTVHMPSPSPETRDCESSLNNIAVEDGRCNNRHMSIDSTRDSGIGEGSNSSNERHMSVDSNSPTSVHRTSLAYRLPENSYYMMSRGCYIFPGAEVMESLCDGSRSDSPVASDASDSEEDEEEGADMNRLGDNE